MMNKRSIMMCQLTARGLRKLIKVFIKKMIESRSLNNFKKNGGSVNYDNLREIIKIPEVDGLAITCASLNPLNFGKIIRLVDKKAKKYVDRNRES